MVELQTAVVLYLSYSNTNIKVVVVVVGVDSPKVAVSCWLGAYRIHLGCSTTARVPKYVCVIRGALFLSLHLGRSG